MDINNQNQFSVALALATSAAASGTVAASTSGARWNLKNMAVGWASMVDSTTLSLYEIDGSQSSGFWHCMLSATSGAMSIDFGGYPASVTNSRLVLNVGASLSLWAVVTGWRTGS